MKWFTFKVSREIFQNEKKSGMEKKLTIAKSLRNILKVFSPWELISLVSKKLACAAVIDTFICAHGKTLISVDRIREHRHLK